MPKIRKKKVVEENVLELARQRLNIAYDIFDTVVVSFSGGKDSTACLNLTLEVARERGRLPLKVFFFDEEAIPFETEHYVRRVAQLDDVEMLWLCLPVKHRNGCSRRSPWWHTWAPEHEDKWVRPLPPEGVTEWSGFPTEVKDRPTIPDCVGLLFHPDEYGRVGMVMGIRADESITRTRAVLIDGKTTEHFIKPWGEGFNHGNLHKVYPIYDWRTPDIWLAPKVLGWDTNAAYDVMEKAGISHHAQRCAPPYGEEPMRALWTFASCFPDIWDKMQVRVPGAATAARLSTTVAYSHGSKPTKPDDTTWEQFIRFWVDKHPEPERGMVAKIIAGHIRSHYGKTAEPILSTAHHPMTGMTWEFLLMIAVRGDLKKRKMPHRDINAVDARRVVYDLQRKEEEEKRRGKGKSPEAGDEAGRW